MFTTLEEFANQTKESNAATGGADAKTAFDMAAQANMYRALTSAQLEELDNYFSQQINSCKNSDEVIKQLKEFCSKTGLVKLSECFK